MATRKRSSSRSSVVDRAVRAGRRAIREAEKRLPPDVRRQIERRLRDADKTARAAIKQLQAQAKKASTRGDVNNVLKRIDDLTRQARQIASSRLSSTRRTAATPKRRAAGGTRKTASTAKRRTTTTGKAAPRKAATGSSASRRRASTRRARPAESAVVATPMTPEMGVMEMGSIEP